MERQEDIERMEAATRPSAGVREVENLVTPPGTLAPASRPKLQRQRSGLVARTVQDERRSLEPADEPQ